MAKPLPLHPSVTGAGADLSPCTHYRYSLWREWAAGKGTVLFIGLNPSTADADTDDRTIRRCIQFGMDWGFQRLEMANLFAFRATDPADMRAALDPVGPETDARLNDACQRASLVVAAWGNNGAHAGRGIAVLDQIRHYNPKCFKVSAKGFPVHPLYQRSDAKLVPYL